MDAFKSNFKQIKNVHQVRQHQAPSNNMRVSHGLLSPQYLSSLTEAKAARENINQDIIIASDKQCYTDPRRKNDD